MRLLVLLLFVALLPMHVKAQAPGLLWITNVGARLFAVDEQTNVYANAGGTVIKLNSAGMPIQTNSICPINGIARRDSAGNYYFAGSFDGTQNFGGITLVGGWTNWPTPGHWQPGYPTCYLAKYASNGALQWVKSFGDQSIRNAFADVIVDASNACYVSTYIYGAGPIGYGYFWRFGSDGTFLWQKLAQGNTVFYDAMKFGGVTASNCCFSLYNSGGGDGSGRSVGGRLDYLGNRSFFADIIFPLYYSTLASTNGRPVLADLGSVFQSGLCSYDACSGQQVLRKYASDGSVMWSMPIPAEQQWVVGGDSLGNVYLACTNGLVSEYDSSGILIWSTNFGSVALEMVVDAHDNRFLFFENGAVARIQSEPTPQKPVITSDPRGQTVFVGSNVTFSAAAMGTQPLRYFWQFESNAIPNATNSTLNLSNVVASQSGNYRMVVTNVAGSATSAPALLRVRSVAIYVGSQLLTNGTYVFSNAPTLTIRSAFTNGSTFYTLDGSVPNFSSTFYSGPFVLSNSATVRALGYNSSFSQSEEADAVNIIVLERHTLSVFTPGGGTIGSYPSTNCITPPAGLVASWQAEGNAADSVNGHNGTVHGSTSYTAGEVGQAFSFDGSTGYIEIPSAPDLKFAGPFTVEAWVNYDRLTGVNGDTVVMKGANQLAPVDWALAISAAGKLRPHCNISGGWYYFDCNTTLATNTWYHVALVYDGAHLQGFLNGALDGSFDVSGSVQISDNPVRIGSYAPSGGSSGSFFAGRIDEVSLYSRALSSSEILSIYLAGHSGKCIPAPLGGSYLETDSVVLTAIPFSGYSFLHWLGDVSGSSPIVSVSMERDKTIEAVFGTTLSTTVAGSGHVDMSPSLGLYPYGSTIRLTAIPDPGNYFGFWGSAATGNTNPLYFIITAPTQTVSSIFGPTPGGQAALTVISSGSGHVNVSPQANAYALNTSVTLTAVPDGGQSFINWSGDASGSQNPLNISMSQGKVITANFSEHPNLRVNRPGLEGLNDAGFRFTLTGEPPSVFQIFGSSNLLSWDSLGFATNVFGEVQFTDTNAPGFSKRFYRSQVQP